MSAVAQRTTGRTAVTPAVGGLAKRSLRNIRRLPSAFVPALLMPIVHVIAFSGTYAGVTDIPGFPTDRSVNWYLPLAVAMGSSFAGLGIGLSTIRDVESGFYDRLRLSPAPRASLIAGPLVTAWSRAVMIVIVVLIVGTALGARLSGGALGLVTLALAGLGLATIGAGWGLGLAFRFGDMRAAAIMQLTLFLGLFLTDAQTPLELIDGWLYDVARLNPLTAILQLGRQGYLDGVTWDDTWGGLVAIGVLGALSLWFARRGLERLQD